ncbi:LamG domain-containing protein [Planctomycetales bacterium ZRK34]|nr:LamG domain-containing protein [Planctomycetales bacterium ZRK34]
MKRLLLMTMLGLAAATGAQAASVLDSAEALWKYDAAEAGGVSVGQITDSSGNGHNASSVVQPGSATLNWTTSPAQSPVGFDAVDLFTDHGRALEFNKAIETNSDVSSAGYTVNGFMLSGSATLVTRLRWDGQIGNTRSWLYSNGGAVNGWLFGIASNSQLTVYQHTTTYDTIATNLPALKPGQWYDVAVVIRDDVESAQATDTFTFYMVGPDGKFYSQTRDRGTLYNGTVTTGNTLVGGESLGTGTSNQTKGFDGALDHLAVWDTALTDAQVRSLLIPTPAALPAGLMLIGLTAMRRRRH